MMPLAANGGGWLSNWWNTHWTAKLIPDVIYINSGFGWDMPGRNNGGSYTTGYAIPIRGKQAGRLYSYQTFSSGFSMHGGYGVNIGYSVYTGNDARNFDFEQLFGGKSIGIVDDLVIGFGYFSSGLDNQGGKLNSLDIGFGWVAGAGSNVHGSTTLNRIW